MRFPARTALRLLALLCACLLAVTAAQARGRKTTTKPESRAAKAAHKTAARRTVRKSSARSVVRKNRKSVRYRRERRPRGQQQIDAERARQIQNALIREHYLDGDATGQWDQRTRDAMTRYQADHGWQTKVLPDSRALISLGLGPSQENLLNPRTAALPRAVAPTSLGLADNPAEADEPQHR